MSISDKPQHSQSSPTKSMATGTLTGTVMILGSGKTYPVTANGFYRYDQRVHLSGDDPEGIEDSFQIEISFNTPEPASGTYKVGPSEEINCSYSLWPSEKWFHAIEGQLNLKNFASVRHLEGELIFTTVAFGDIPRYKVDIVFSITGN